VGMVSFEVLAISTANGEGVFLNKLSGFFFIKIVRNFAQQNGVF
jgi:hypothetical protein